MNPIGWFEIYVEDMARAKKFYEGVFEKTLSRLESTEMEMWTFPMDDKAYGAGGALVKMAGMSPGGGGTLVYFTTEDCAHEAKRVPDQGGKIIKSKFSIGDYGFIALIQDSEGNLIGLHSLQ